MAAIPGHLGREFAADELAEAIRRSAEDNGWNLEIETVCGFQFGSLREVVSSQRIGATRQRPIKKDPRGLWESFAHVLFPPLERGKSYSRIDIVVSLISQLTPAGRRCDRMQTIAIFSWVSLLFAWLIYWIWASFLSLPLFTLFVIVAVPLVLIVISGIIATIKLTIKLPFYRTLTAQEIDTKEELAPIRNFLNQLSG